MRVVRMAGGEPAVAQAVADAIEARGAVVRAIATGAPNADSPVALVDLGLPPAEWPAGEALVAAEAERVAALLRDAPPDARLIRVSILGAGEAAASLLQRAQAAAEAAVAAHPGGSTVLRVGVLLGPCGPIPGLHRRIERTPVLLLPPIGRAKLEPLALPDLAEYVAATALDDGPFDDRYDLGGGQVLTGGLLVRGMADNLGVRRLFATLPGVRPSAVARWYATPEYPAVAVQRWLEAVAEGLLPRRMTAWEHFSVKPTELRLAMAAAVGMAVPLRRAPETEGSFSTWKKPEKKGILWTKPKR